MANPFSLSGRRALVVGADSGIGLASARALAEAGADLVMAGLEPAEGEATAAAIAEATGRKVAFLLADVRREEQVEAMVAAAIARLGGLDIAMNNAGVPGTSGPIEALSAQDFDDLFAINVRGAWLCMKHEIPHLAASGNGSIINLASTAALTGLPFAAAYAATKHAVAGLTRSVALELAGRGVRVNAIAPGPVDTGLLHTMRGERARIPDAVPARVPLGRVAQPEEMTGAVVWLASDAASFVTGAIVSLDGGVTAA